MKRILFFILISINYLSLFSQEMKISGSILDTNIYQPVYNAKTYLIRINDSVIYQYQNTNIEGEFEYLVPIDNYRLIIAHPLYNNKEFLFAGTQENKTFELGEFSLPDKSDYLEDIVIYAYKDPVYYKGDTLIYVADSFATKENAMVEDLLKKLPGITVESDGSITSQGKNIDKVYVDGDEFFGSDPTVATKNLAAKSIDKVQVYEKSNDDDPLSEEKLQILDLRLKPEAKKGWFAKANVAMDFYHFYEGQLLFNRFQNKQQIFAFGLGSNTLNSSISASDAQQMGVNSRALGSSGGVSGLPQTFKAGALFNDQITDKFKLGVNYLFNDNRVKSENEKNTQYLLKDTTYSTESKTLQNRMNQSHNLSLNLNFKLDSTSTLSWAPTFTLTNSNNSNQTTNRFIDENGTDIRLATNTNESKSLSYGIRNNLNYTKNFLRSKARLVVRDNFSFQRNQSTSEMHYDDYFYLLDTTQNEIQQQKKNLTNNFANTFTAVFTHPVSERWKMSYDYELYNNISNLDLQSFDFDNGSYSSLDSLSSNRFNTNKFQNKLGLSTTYAYKNQQLTFGLRARNILTNNENFFTDVTIRQNETSALPFLNYRYKISQNANLSFSTTTNSSLPTVEQLSPARDNTNPNNISIGNENLKSNYNINANLRYMIFKPISGINFNAGASARYTFNDFARSINYDNLGRSTSQYENINTFNNVSGNMGLSIPVFKKILTINPMFNYTLANQNSIVDGLQNLTTTHNFMPQLRLMVNSEYIEYTTNVRLTEQIGKNTMDEHLNINNSVWNWSNELKAYLPGKVDIVLSGNYYNYSNLAQGFNSNYFIMNASIAKRLGKYDEWTLAVEGYDLLNQNTQLSRTFTLNTIVDSRTNIISRYFLFRVTYSFNSTLRIKTNKNENQ